jgi:hypothetical protein
VKSLRYNGEDITDDPMELKSGRNADLEFVISSRGATVSGRAFGDDGQPAKGAVAVMFPADQRHWKRREPSTCLLTDTGAFKMDPRRPGDYFVVVLDSFEPLRDGGSRELFTRLAQIAEHITLAENEERTLDLRIVHLK